MAAFYDGRLLLNAEITAVKKAEKKDHYRRGFAGANSKPVVRPVKAVMRLLLSSECGTFHDRYRCFWPREMRLPKQALPNGQWETEVQLKSGNRKCAGLGTVFSSTGASGNR